MKYDPKKTAKKSAGVAVLAGLATALPYVAGVIPGPWSLGIMAAAALLKGVQDYLTHR